MASNMKLFVAIGIFLALAVFGAAVFSGYSKKDADAPAIEEQLAGTPDGILSENQQTAETQADDYTDYSDADVTPAQGGAPFDLAASLAPRGIGNPNAPIKIVEYASLTCNHCARFHNDYFKAIKEKYVDTGKVYFEFREFPLNAPALDASLLARCVSADRYESFTNLLFKTQSDWMERPDYLNALKQNAKLAGLSEDGATECLASQQLREAIGTQIQEASDKYKVSSTPTFVFNDGAESIRGAMPVDEFDRVIARLSGDTAAPSPSADEQIQEESIAPVEEPAAE